MCGGAISLVASKLGRSEPFAISHLRLMKEDQTALQDGTYELFVYKVGVPGVGSTRWVCQGWVAFSDSCLHT